MGLFEDDIFCGSTQPLNASAAVKAESDALILVDGISSAGSIPVPVDEWGIDVLVSGSQKGWAVPPGLAMMVTKTDTQTCPTVLKQLAQAEPIRKVFAISLPELAAQT